MLLPVLDEQVCDLAFLDLRLQEPLQIHLAAILLLLLTMPLLPLVAIWVSVPLTTLSALAAILLVFLGFLSDHIDSPLCLHGYPERISDPVRLGAHGRRGVYLDVVIIQLLNLVLDLHLLRLDEGEDDDREDQVHQEELAHDDHRDHEDHSEDWDIHIHKIQQVLVPGVRVNDLKNTQQAFEEVVEVCDPEINVVPETYVLTVKGNLHVFLMIPTVHPVRAYEVAVPRR